MYTVVNIDDEPMVKKTLRVLVDGYQGAFQVIGEAEDGKEGLALIERCAPDLVITDLNMPVMSGLEMIESLRSRGIRTEIAVLSGYDDFQYAQEAMRFGVMDYVLKPIRPAAVGSLLERVMHKRETESRLPRGRHAWIGACREAAYELTERIWLLDEEGAKEAVSRYVSHVEEAAGSEDALREALPVLLTLVSTELESRGGGVLAASLPELANPAQALEAAMERITDKIEELGRSRRIGSHPGILHAVKYIKEKFHHPLLTLPEAAEAGGMSQAHFSRTFKKEMGVSFIEYLTALRMQKAKELLTEPGSKTWEIAEAVGYQEYAHFAKVFRKNVGFTPSEYRKQAAKGEQDA